MTAREQVCELWGGEPFAMPSDPEAFLRSLNIPTQPERKNPMIWAISLLVADLAAIAAFLVLIRRHK